MEKLKLSLPFMWARRASDYPLWAKIVFIAIDLVILFFVAVVLTTFL